MTTVAPHSAAVGLALDLDPGLGVGIPDEDWEAARRAARGELVRVPAGRWKLPAGAGERHDLLGLLILHGLLCREVALRDRHMLELLGPGDILQVPLTDGRPRLGGEIVITAATEAGALALGRAFAAAAGRWPSILAALHRRLEAQRERLAIQGLITHLPRAEHRLLLALWHLADRWGQVTPAGIVLPLPLTHAVLGQLTGARRSTTTIAARELQSEGLIERLNDGSWLLTTAAEPKIQAITRTSPTIRALGELLTLHQRINDTQQNARALHGETHHIDRGTTTISAKRAVQALPAASTTLGPGPRGGVTFDVGGRW